MLILSFQITVFGQFNTLTPTLPKKNGISKSNRASKRNRQSEAKKKESHGRIFNITSKAKLKNELDSLKAILKENSSANNKKWDRQNCRIPRF